MKDSQEKVREFHRKFQVYISQQPVVPPAKVRELRKELIEEELVEFERASDAGDMIGVADGLGDLLYVVLGAACAWGLNIEPIFDEIHRSNMTKEGGHLSPSGKIIKPDGYSPPNLAPLIEEQVGDLS